jgi:peptidoglycan/xylan/chitin deacetylase (PgdA/CDA1 family)
LAAERPGEDPWAALARELDLWAEAGRTATLWWRDDDAAEVTPTLDRLLGLGALTGAPIALAVIPGAMAPGLPAHVAVEGVVVIQHGWRHVNYAGTGAGAWELGDHRPLEQVAADLEAGHRRLAGAFGPQFFPALAPPWNRISARVIEALPALGYVGLSTFGARAAARPAAGLVQVNTHCDPVKWRQQGRFAGTAPTLDDVTRHLAARRAGTVDPAEPTGIVTHHLAMDEQAFGFVAELLRRTTAHPAACWLSAPDAFRP